LVLDDAGFYWKGVAGEWETLGDRWKKIQNKFEIIGLLENVSSIAANMGALGIELPSTFTNMFADIMDTFGNNVLNETAGLFNTLSPLFLDDSFWNTLASTTEEATKTIAEMADEFLNSIQGATGFNDAISQFTQNGIILENAGYYWRDVAGGWDMLGKEWAKIQAQFQVMQIINSFIQSANAMKQMGVVLPATFEATMYDIMQAFAINVLPDFQGVIDELLGAIDTEGFWDALANGISQADIRQSNSIVMAPYIQIESGMNNEEILGLINQALIDEAKRNGFSWTG
jgi:hypothetical protein